MPKEITNKAKKEIYIKCKKCADEIFIDTRKKMTYCKCKTIINYFTIFKTEFII